MISLTPTGSPAQTSDAYTLLAIIADPAAAKKRLDDLVAAARSAQETLDSARAATKEAEDSKAAAAVSLGEATRLRDVMDAEHEVRTKQFTDHEAFLTTKQTQIEAYDAKVIERESGLAAREAAVSARETSVTNRESLARQLSTEAKALKDEYEGKTAALHAALSSPKSHVLNAEPGSLGASMGGE